MLSPSTATPSAAPKHSDERPTTDFLSTAQVAKLMNITPATLRNYTWLATVPKRERAMRNLQNPPRKMPRPKRLHGALFWSAEPFYKWLDQTYLPNAKKRRLLG